VWSCLGNLSNTLHVLSSHLLCPKKLSSAVWVVLMAEVPRCQACSSSRWSCSDEEKGGRTEHAMRKKKMCVGGLL
jgi:hypothetical protein